MLIRRYGRLLIIVIVMIALLLVSGGISKRLPSFAYVFSDSMVPAINVYDVFVIYPAASYNEGDIVLFRPLRLDASLITHRIVGHGSTGFITKGDNSPFTDQMSGEPEIEPGRIVGKVAGINGKPFIIPGLGRFFGNMPGDYMRYVRVFAICLIITGVIMAICGLKHPKRDRKSHSRWKLKNLYILIVTFSLSVFILGNLFGTRVNKVKYLVSENPGSKANHVRVGKAGIIEISVRNMGVLPAWHFSSGFSPVKIKTAPRIIMPRSSQNIAISIPVHQETGWYNCYVEVHQYPVLLPYSLLLMLHQKSPFLALISVCFAYCFLLILMIRIINRIMRVGAQTPLRALRNKKLKLKLRGLSKKIPFLRRSRR